MYPTRLRVSTSRTSTARPKSDAFPSVAGSSPVSIFIVVVLPQPLDPRKPKISPLLDAEAHVIDRGEVTEAAGQIVRLDRRLRCAGSRGGMHEAPCPRRSSGRSAM